MSYLFWMLSWHGCVSRHGPTISAVTVAIGSMALEVQLLGHPAHGLQRLGLLLFSQLLHCQESETDLNLNRTRPGVQQCQAQGLVQVRSDNMAGLFEVF